MNDAARQFESVTSPCVQICKLDEHGICIGCFRTAGEIANWLGYSEARRRQIIEALPGRAARALDGA